MNAGKIFLWIYFIIWIWMVLAFLLSFSIIRKLAFCILLFPAGMVLFCFLNVIYTSCEKKCGAFIDTFSQHTFFSFLNYMRRKYAPPLPPITTTVPECIPKKENKVKDNRNLISCALTIFLPQDITKIVIEYGLEANQWLCAERIEYITSKPYISDVPFRTHFSFWKWIEWSSSGHVIMKRNWGHVILKLEMDTNDVKISIRKDNENIFRWVKINRKQFILLVFGLEFFHKEKIYRSLHFCNMDEKLIQDSFLERLYDELLVEPPVGTSARLLMKQ